MDEHIPKRIRILVEEYFSVVLIHPSKKLTPILTRGDYVLLHLQHAVLNIQ